jgi:hypothetical protein
VFESARSFWLKVSRAASTTTRKVWKPASSGFSRSPMSKLIRFDPSMRSRALVARSWPSAYSRTVAGWATLETIVATASMVSPSGPSRASGGALRGPRRELRGR